MSTSPLTTPDEITAIRKALDTYLWPEAAAVDALYIVQQRYGWIDDTRLEAFLEEGDGD